MSLNPVLLVLFPLPFLQSIHLTVSASEANILNQVENFATQSVAIDTFRHCHRLSLSFHLTKNTGVVLRTMERGKEAL
jgi:hypothetical protein